MRKLFKTCLAVCLAALALSENASAQTFTLTANNTSGNLYKVTGSTLTALTTSPGSNTINPGDIIVIPWIDPSLVTTTNGIVVTANPSGTSPVSISWTTKGDMAVVTGGGATTSARLNTYNENVRPGSTFDLGQSKGRVTYRWATTPNTCGDQVMYFDVYKSFIGTNVNGTPSSPANVPPIIGPNCLLPNTQYTYSVDPVVSDNLSDQIGLDRYFWNTGTIGIQASTTYYSTDSSSITFTTNSNPLSSGSATLTCALGVGNTAPYGSNTAVSTKTINAAAGIPVVTASGNAGITGAVSASNCLPTFLTGTHSLTLTVTSQPGATYQWGFGTNGGTLANGWNTSPAATGAVPYTSTGTSLTIVDVLNQPGVITLTVTDACGNPAVYTYGFGRQLTQTNAALITGMASPLCVTAGNSVTGTVVPNANQNNVTWSNSNFTFTSGGSPYSITPLSTLATGTYTVTATFGCSTSATYPINVVSINAPTISVVGGGSACGTAASMISFTANPAPLTGTTYTWSLTGGTGYTCSGCGTATANSTVTVTIGTSGTASLTLKENTSGSSTCSSPVSTPTSIGIAPSTFAITTPCAVINQPSSIVLACTNVSPATYQWAVSPTSTYGSLFAATTTIPQDSFRALGNVYGTVTYSVTATLSSGCVVTATLNSTLASSPAPFVLDAQQDDPSGDFTTIGVHGSPLGAQYFWTECTVGPPPARVGSDLTVSSGSFNTQPTTGNSSWNLVNTGAAKSYGARMLSRNGCQYLQCEAITGGYVNRIRNGLPNLKDANAPYFTVYPNPNNGVFQIEIGNTGKIGTMAVFNSAGQKISENPLKPGTNEFDMKLPAGIYQIQMNVDGFDRTEKLVITD